MDIARVVYLALSSYLLLLFFLLCCAFLSHQSVNHRPLRLKANSGTVTEAPVLHPLLEDWGRITESICILVPVDRVKRKCFQITTKQVCWSQQFQLRRNPVYFIFSVLC